MPELFKFAGGSAGTGSWPLCAGEDPEEWFGVPTDHARELCAACPVRVECLAGALARGERFGMWGGELLEGSVQVVDQMQKAERRREIRQAALFVTRNVTREVKGDAA